MQNNILYPIDESQAWLAVYLYYAEPWERISREALQPFVGKMRQEGHVQQYFYIRYWEKGPHLRLRFKGKPDTLLHTVKPAIEAYFGDYMKKKPSERTVPEWLENAEEEHQWYPNNTLQYITYEPEIARYGGKPWGMDISERQFQASSDAILEIISESEDWDYNRALGAAIQMHLGFAYGLGMDLAEASAFYARVFENWLPRAYYHFSEELTQEELKARRDETLKAFEKNFEQQRDNLLPFFETVWEALQEGQEFEQDWLNRWVRDMEVTGEDLKKIQKEGKLEPPSWYVLKSTDDTPRLQVERWAIYDSYVHMTNNRLGIQNRDESYLGYLIKESFNTFRVNLG